MKRVLSILLIAGAASGAAAEETPLKDVFGDRFLIGAAINDRQAKEIDTKAAEVVKRDFKCVVAEYVMKSEEIHPEKGV